MWLSSGSSGGLCILPAAIDARMALAPGTSVRLYYQPVDDARERALGRVFRFQTFDESDAGRNAARAARFLPTARILSRGEFERNRAAIVRDVKRALRLDVKEKELQADGLTKEAAALARVKKLQEASRVLKQALMLVPAHAGARQVLAQVERAMKEPTASSDEYLLLARIRSVSYQTRVGGQVVSRSGEMLEDYVFGPKGHTRPGFQVWGRVQRKSDVVRDHAKLVEGLLRDRNLVVTTVKRGTTKALSWTKAAPAGWQEEITGPYRDVRESRTLVVKDRIPFAT
jgi:hypothetical protein